jgi:hypothetical protein
MSVFFIKSDKCPVLFGNRVSGCGGGRTHSVAGKAAVVAALTDGTIDDTEGVRGHVGSFHSGKIR